jgi:GMP synthase (glutamine-hydrolysing)
MSHGDQISEIPPEFICIGGSDNAPIAAMAHLEKPWYGLQFHPEVTHTAQGQLIIERFLYRICGCQANWTPDQIIETLVEEARQQVGPQEQVILGASGGVDSSVVAALLHEALGEQLTCIFVDNGLLRLEEAKEVMAVFKEHEIQVIQVDAAARFYAALAGIHCPEAKRKQIGKTFIEVFEEQAAKLPNAKWLAQGTIYPDVVESAGTKTGKAQVIKSHHNVGGLPETMQLKLIEPLKTLFKDEVRKIGLRLGLPQKMIFRHPFPGPGLGVRILGEVKPEYAAILRQADAIFIEVLRKHDFYAQVNQAFAVFLPVKSVGVMGDARQYDYVVALRAVETIDFMTARWAHLPYTLLEEASSRIINEVTGISRVTYDISSKPPATIEWE